MKNRNWIGFALRLTTLAVAASHSPAQSNYTPYTFTTFAGDSGYGSVDGTGNVARFNNPQGAAADTQGNVYVADTLNSTIRRVTPAGVVTTFVGLACTAGTNDGTGTSARFFYPQGVVVDSTGNLYVADTGNSTIRKVTASGVVTTLAGLAGVSGTNDATGNAARFDWPIGVAVDTIGNIYVADTGNNTIRKVNPTGEVTTLAGLARTGGSADGTGSAAQFHEPVAVGLGSDGNVYVADSFNHTIRKVTPLGEVTTLAGLAGNRGSADGTGSTARFNYPYGMAVDSGGNLYVADEENDTIRKITPTGDVTTLAGLALNYGNADGTGSTARFNGPSGVALDTNGNVYVADTGNGNIRKVTPAGEVTTLAGLPYPRDGSADGTGSAARFYGPSRVAVDSAGNVYVADYDNATIRKVTSAGVVTTLAGLAGTYGTNDGMGSDARFNSPSGVAVDTNGNIYVADQYNYTIRKITPDGLVTTLAGSPCCCAGVDGTGSAAHLQPSGVAVDTHGNVYVADIENNAIRKVTPGGVVTTLAGVADFNHRGSADGTGTNAWFYAPFGVALDTHGNLYVTDGGNYTLRKVTPTGVVTTMAGQAGQRGSADGTGSAARFGGTFNQGPRGVAVDAAGNVYVTDPENYTIRKVTPAGVVTTLGGLAGVSGSTDGTGIAARFGYVSGIAVDNAGNIYVGDFSTIRKGVLPGNLLNIYNVAVTEGDSGTMNALFSVLLATNHTEIVSVDFATSDGTAAAGSDYVATNGTLIFASGETNKTITVQVIGDLLPEADETFFVNLSNPTNIVLAFNSAQGIILDDDTPPFITSQPQSQSVPLGSNVTFGVSASGAPPLLYQWRTNGTDLAGATNATLTRTNVQLAEDGNSYTVRVSGKLSSILSDAAVLTVLAKPVITAQPTPTNETVVAGSTVSVSVSAVGTLPLSYGWRLNGAKVTNIVLNSYTCVYTIENVQTNQAGSYRVAITNAVGNALALSAAAVLTVLADSDHDGMPDDWELLYGFDPNNASDGAQDADGDKLTNLQEYIAGTDPRDPLSYLKVDAVQMPGGSGGAMLRFVAVSNRTYTVLFRAAVDHGEWSRVADVAAAPTNRLINLPEASSPTGNLQRFYRLVTPGLP